MRRTLLILLIAFAAAAPTACSDDAGPDVEFTEGEIPATLPSDIPIPAEAVIGSGLIDRVNDRTEVTFRLPADVEVAARYFDVNLVNAGYVLSSSSGSGSRWIIEFTKEGVDGEIDISQADVSVSQVAVTVRRS